MKRSATPLTSPGTTRFVTLFVLALVVVTVLMTTPPIAAQPLLTPSRPVLDTGDEALRIADRATQMVDWLLDNDNNNADKSETLNNDNSNSADKSERQTPASQK